MARNKIFSIILFIASIIAFFFGAELILRSKGYRLKLVDTSRESIVYNFDSVLGWKNKPGIYTKWRVDNVKVTIFPDASRATHIPQQEKAGKIITVGCSYTLGWAVSDNETFAWRLQENFPSLQVLNYGTGAYGTYQSLLLLEKIFSDQPPPLVALYGFCDFHEIRNVATSSWLRGLWQSSKRGRVAVPYCSIDENFNLIRHAPEPYPKWPFVESSALLDYLQLKYVLIKDKLTKLPQKELVTRKILLEMNNLCRVKNSRFIVVLLQCEKSASEHYLDFFKKEGIEYIDCLDINITRLKGDWHPDGSTNLRWANRISKYLNGSFH